MLHPHRGWTGAFPLRPLIDTIKSTTESVIYTVSSGGMGLGDRAPKSGGLSPIEKRHNRVVILLTSPASEFCAPEHKTVSHA